MIVTRCLNNLSLKKTGRLILLPEMELKKTGRLILLPEM